MTTEKLTIAQAITRALGDELETDTTVILQGEDIGALGGVYRVTDGLHERFGADRVVDAPLTESGILGTAVGLALAGYRPVAEIQFDGFIYPAYDQITSQLAKMRTRLAGTQDMPVTVRVPYGGGIGSVEHHGESPEVLFAHTAGLRILTYSTAHDAYWITRAAIRSQDPVLLFEPKRRYFTRSEVNLDDPGDANRSHDDVWRAVLRREGTDATLVVWGAMTAIGLAAAEAAAEEGRSLEVLELRGLAPIDHERIAASVQKTGRALVVHEATKFAGLGAEISARITEDCFLSLEAPVQRVAGWYIPYPPASIENQHIPDVDRILDALDTSFTYL